jgi:4-amino-4-deoxy-L-arabinose transferase-like glycosyltransferase
MTCQTTTSFRYGPAIVFIVGVFLLFPGIWSETGITGQDEYWLSLRTPMETLERGEWFTPWVNGEPRLRKPPLLYWTILFSYKLFGINLISARIWGVLSGAGLAAATCLLYRILFSRKGVLSGLICLATISVAIEGRRAMLDLPLAFFSTTAVYFALRWGKSGHIGWILLSAFSLGISFLIKGPVGLGFFATAAISALFLFRKWRFALSNWPQILWGLLLLLAVCSPWPLAMAYLWPNFLGIVDGEMAARGFGTLHFKSVLSTLGGALALVFPWSLILAGALIWSIKRAKQPEYIHYFWLSVWFLGSIVPCLFMKSFARYMVPTIPAACILCAGFLEHSRGRLKDLLLRISVSLFAFVAASFCLFFVWFDLGLPIAIGCLFFVGVMLWITFVTGKIHMVSLSLAILLAFIMGGLYPTLGMNAMPANIESLVGSEPVAVFNSSQPSMLSMRLRRSVIPIRPFREEDLRLLKSFDGFVFMRQADDREFQDLAKKLDIHLENPCRFETLYSRQAWIRFAREGATLKDWIHAARKRSLDDLRTSMLYYRVYPDRNERPRGKTLCVREVKEIL